MNAMEHIAAVVLAAGRGSRLNCNEIPKVMCEIGDRPIVSYTVDTLESLGLSGKQISLVVGFQKEKVMDYFDGRVQFAVQEELKGTAHAALTGMQTLGPEVEHVLVLGGDDSAFYTKESLTRFVEEHVDAGVKLSLLSVEVDDPTGLGRIVRHENGDIEVIEKEYVTEEQAKIQEVSTGTYIFERAWFEQMYPSMPPLRKLGEYALPTAMAMCRDAALPYQVVPLGKSQEWFGVNTPEQLAEADKRKRNT